MCQQCDQINGTNIWTESVKKSSKPDGQPIPQPDIPQEETEPEVIQEIVDKS